MKKTIFYILFVCLFVSTGLASYSYEVYTYDENSKILNNFESILFDHQGGMDMVDLRNNSSANILGTSDLAEFFGGIWHIQLGYTSSISMSGGQVHMININNSATAELRGGLIQEIYSYQTTKYWDTDNQVWVDTPHIKLYYSGDLPTIDTIGGYDYLVGAWGSGDNFRIYLPDTGYDVYGNFEFILVPEPATLILLGLGGLLIRRKR